MDPALSRFAISQCTHGSVVCLVTFSQTLSDTADTNVAMHVQNTLRTLYHLTDCNMKIFFKRGPRSRQYRYDPPIHGKAVMLHIFLQDHISRMCELRPGAVLSVSVFHRDCQYSILKRVIPVLQESIRDRLFDQLLFSLSTVEIYIIIQ